MPWTHTLEDELRPILKKYSDENGTCVCAAWHKQSQIYFFCYTGKTYYTLRFNLAQGTINNTDLKSFLYNVQVVFYEVFDLNHLSLATKIPEPDDIDPHIVYLSPHSEEKSGKVVAKWYRRWGWDSDQEFFITKDLNLKCLQDAKLPAFPNKNAAPVRVNLYTDSIELFKTIYELIDFEQQHFCFDYNIFFKTVGILYREKYFALKLTDHDFKSSSPLTREEILSSMESTLTNSKLFKFPTADHRFAACRIGPMERVFNKVILCPPKSVGPYKICWKLDDQPLDDQPSPPISEIYANIIKRDQCIFYSLRQDDGKLISDKITYAEYMRYSSQSSIELNIIHEMIMHRIFADEKAVYLYRANLSSDSEITAMWKHESNKKKLSEEMLPSDIPPFPNSGEDFIEITSKNCVDAILNLLDLSRLPIGLIIEMGKFASLVGEKYPLSFSRNELRNEYFRNKKKLENYLTVRCTDNYLTFFLKNLDSKSPTKPEYQHPANLLKLFDESNSDFLDKKSQRDSKTVLVYHKPSLITSATNINYLILNLMVTRENKKSIIEKIKELVNKSDFTSKLTKSKFSVTFITTQIGKAQGIRLIFPEVRKVKFGIDLITFSVELKNSKELKDYLFWKSDFLFIDTLKILVPREFITELSKISSMPPPREEIIEEPPVNEEFKGLKCGIKKVWTTQNAQERANLVVIDNALNFLTKSKFIPAAESKLIFNYFKHMLISISDVEPQIVLNFIESIIISKGWTPKNTNSYPHYPKLPNGEILPPMTATILNHFPPFNNESNWEDNLKIIKSYYTELDSPNLITFYLQVNEELATNEIIRQAHYSIYKILKNLYELPSSDLKAENLPIQYAHDLVIVLQAIFIKFLIIKGACYGAYTKEGKIENFKVKYQDPAIIFITKDDKQVVVLQNKETISKYLAGLNKPNKNVATFERFKNGHYSYTAKLTNVIPIFQKVAEKIPDLNMTTDEFFLQASVLEDEGTRYNTLSPASFPPDAVEILWILWEFGNLVLSIQRLDMGNPSQHARVNTEINIYESNAEGYYQSSDDTLLTPAELCKQNRYLATGGTKGNPLKFQRLIPKAGLELIPLSQHKPIAIDLGVAKLSYERVIVMMCVNDELFEPFKKKACAAYTEAGIPFLCITLITNRLTQEQISEIVKFLEGYKEASFEFQIAGRGTAKLCNVFGASKPEYSWRLSVAAEQILNILTSYSGTGYPTIYLISSKAAGYMTGNFCVNFETLNKQNHCELIVKINASYEGVYTNLNAQAEFQVSAVQGLGVQGGISQYINTRAKKNKFNYKSRADRRKWLCERRLANESKKSQDSKEQNKLKKVLLDSFQLKEFIDELRQIFQSKRIDSLLLEKIFTQKISLAQKTGRYSFFVSSSQSSSPSSSLSSDFFLKEESKGSSLRSSVANLNFGS